MLREALSTRAATACILSHLLRKVVSSFHYSRRCTNDAQLVVVGVALMLDARARRLGPFSWRCPFGVCGGRMCKQKVRGLEEPKRTRQKVSRSAASCPNGFPVTITARSSSASGMRPRRLVCADREVPRQLRARPERHRPGRRHGGRKIELEEACLETGRITLFGLRSRARMDDVVAKAAAYCDARR